MPIKLFDNSKKISFVIGDIKDYERFYSTSKYMDVMKYLCINYFVINFSNLEISMLDNTDQS